jgi:hypothetical protein
MAKLQSEARAEMGGKVYTAKETQALIKKLTSS